jgi:hypothetical protein
MHGHKPFGDDGHPDIEPSGEEVFYGGHPVVRKVEHGLAELPSRPARQRVELRSEQQWLKRQLADWDDFDFDDLEEL